MTEFDAAEIARGVGELYEPLADDKGIQLKVDAPVAAPVHGNRELVSQALANLVDNAIKYGAPDGERVNGAGSEIVIKAMGEGDRILLAVADSGRGIPAPDRGRAVERFVRLEQSRSQPGSGLGLSLASAVARLHGGELKLEDNDPGLKTVISLPRAGAVPAVKLILAVPFEIQENAMRARARQASQCAVPRCASRLWQIEIEPACELEPLRAEIDGTTARHLRSAGPAHRGGATCSRRGWRRMRGSKTGSPRSQPRLPGPACAGCLPLIRRSKR